MKNPSRMEFFIWGLLSLLPQGIAYSLRPTGYRGILELLGICGFPLALSIATGRAAHSVRIGTWVFASWLVALLILLPLAGVFQIDSRWYPPTIHLLPIPYMISNPAGMQFCFVAFPVCYGAICATIVRFLLRRTARPECHILVIMSSSACLAIFLTIHVKTLSKAMNIIQDRSGAWFIAGIYAILLAFGLYFVALFYDFSPRLPLHKPD